MQGNPGLVPPSNAVFATGPPLLPSKTYSPVWTQTRIISLVPFECVGAPRRHHTPTAQPRQFHPPLTNTTRHQNPPPVPPPFYRIGSLLRRALPQPLPSCFLVPGERERERGVYRHYFSIICIHFCLAHSPGTVSSFLSARGVPFAGTQLVPLPVD